MDLLQAKRNRASSASSDGHLTNIYRKGEIFLILPRSHGLKTTNAPCMWTNEIKKKREIGHPEHSLPPPPTSDNISFCPSHSPPLLYPSHRTLLKLDVICVSPLKLFIFLFIYLWGENKTKLNETIAGTLDWRVSHHILISWIVRNVFISVFGLK